MPGPVCCSGPGVHTAPCMHRAPVRLQLLQSRGCMEQPFSIHAPTFTSSLAMFLRCFLTWTQRRTRAHGLDVV